MKIAPTCSKHRDALSLDVLYAPIVEDIRKVERIFDSELKSDLRCVEQLCNHARGYRGKMLRPALVLLAGQTAGKLTPDHHVLAAVVEMVHMATLVHDDVLDDASKRRRQSTVNSISGNVAAVLLGDYLISHAFHLCSSLDSQLASRLVGATTNTVCEGELLQNHLRGRLTLSEDEYFAIIRRKTAALTAVCCQLGALHAGANPEQAARLHEYGLSSGIAFQIVDDVLDIIGEEETVGKTLGRDFDSGKLTLPTIHCLNETDNATRERFLSMMRPGSDTDSSTCRELLTASGSIDYAIDVARKYVDAAVEALLLFDPSPARESLTTMASFIVDRQF